MYILIFIMLLIFLFIIALFTELADVAMDLNTDHTQFCITVSWLSGFVSAGFYNKGTALEYSIYLLKWRVVSKRFNPAQKNKKRNNIAMLQSLCIEQADGGVFYGFSSPFFTGISLGFFPAFQTLVSNFPIRLVPDFFSDHIYLIVKANAKISLGKTAVNILRSKNKRRENYGSA